MPHLIFGGVQSYAIRDISPIGVLSMYVSPNFKTKKALKEAVAAGTQVTVFNPGPFGSPPENGAVTIEGPHYPEPHKWYARVTVTNGVVTKVS